MKKSVSLQLNIGEIIYDIQNKTYLTGRSLPEGGDAARRAHMQANDDEENEAQIMRSVTMAYARLRNRLSEYLDTNDSASTNDLLSSEENMVLSLEMPSNFNNSVAKAIGEAAHQFIVATAIADWFAITAKGETSDYSCVAQESLRVLEETLCKRVRPKRNGI